MAHCLMQINQCGFPNCGQHFANQYDLTAHIEYTHIPMIEEDVKRKAIAAASISNGDQAPPLPNNLPLSYYSRVFRTAYRPNPIKPEPLKVSFNHYKRRVARPEKILPPPHQYHRIYREMMAKQGRSISLEDAERRLSDVDFEECGPEDNEVRFRCQIVDCMKRYKSMFALRMHMKLTHAVSVSEDAKSLTNYPPEDVKPPTPISHPQPIHHMNGPQQDSHVSSGKPSHLLAPNNPNIPLAQSSPLPSVAQSFGNPATNLTSYKCTYCSKRYKTSSGLSNHMMSSHQKISDIQDAPSPQVLEQLISQARMQRQQQEQSTNDQNQQRGTPAASSHQQSLGNNSHIRSYTVTSNASPLRFSQQHYQGNMDNQPSTGQVLQMQMQHQRRLKQIQEQQAAAAAAQQQQQQQQQQVQSHSQQQPMQQQQQMQSQQQHQQHHQQQHQTVASHLAQGPSPQQFAPQQQSMGPPMGNQQMMQQGQGSQQQQMGQIQQQQFHHISMQQQQQQSPYPQQMQHHHPMNQNSMQHHHYQQQNQYQHQQSPQFPYQQQSPHHPSPQQQGPPQRSPIPLSQALPPLNSMTQRQQMQSMPPPNSAPMHLSPPNQQRPLDHSGYGMMTSPPNGQQHPQQQQQQQQIPHPPPPYNM